MNDKHIAKAREIVLEKTGFRRDYPNATWEEIMALEKTRSRHSMSRQEAESWVYDIAKALTEAYEQGKASQVALRIEGLSDSDSAFDRANNKFFKDFGRGYSTKNAKWFWEEALIYFKENLRQTEYELVLPKEKDTDAELVPVFERTRWFGFNEALDAIKKLNPHLKTRVEGET